MTFTDPSTNRKIIKLRKRIIEFRTKYLALAKQFRFNDDHIKTAEVNRRERYLKGETPRQGVEKKRYIYYVKSDLNWIEPLLIEHQTLLRLISNYKTILTQAYWLPHILQNIKHTHAKKYKAYSVKSGITYKELKDLHKKKFSLFKRKKFKSRRRTGMQYRLVIVSNTNERQVLSFQDWGICICDTDHKPTMYGREEENPPIERIRLKVSPTKIK